MVHHPGIKTAEMGNKVKSKNKDLEDAQNSFIYNQVMPELNLLHGTRKGCQL